MSDTFEQTAKTRAENLIKKQEAEPQDLMQAIHDEERERAAGQRSAVRADAGRELADAIAAVETSIRQDKRADQLLAKLETTLPAWFDGTFPRSVPATPPKGDRA